MVASILAAHEGRIGPVKVYGSRAMGRARPGSDLDLVIFPPASESELTKLWLAFEESDLPITVDLVAWDRISNARFRAEIEEHAIPFKRENSQ
jgi:predicted nucleotidyltransferase